MKEDLKALLGIAEYIEELFPSMGYMSFNSKLLPPNIVVVGTTEDSVTNLIKPKCEKLNKECNFKFRVNFEKAQKELNDEDKNNSVYNPIRFRSHDKYDCCYIFFEDKLQSVSMWLEAQGKTDLYPLPLVVQNLRKEIYPTIMGENKCH